MKKLSFVVMMVAALSMWSCDEVSKVLEEDGLSDATIADGLKEALKVGTDTATSILSVSDGYFKDQAVKILLPESIELAIANLKSKSLSLGSIAGVSLGSVTGAQLYEGYPSLGIPSLKAKEDDLILGLNRAAESAAKSAGPIFWGAITDMSILDAKSILFGEDTAATHFLKEKTYSNLFTKFEPKMDSVLAIVKVNDKSVVSMYEDYVSTYNTVLNTAVGGKTVASQTGLSTLAATDVSEYTTNKGLTGLFLKVSEEEKDIRLDPFARVNDLLVQVFGELDK